MFADTRQTDSYIQNRKPIVKTFGLTTDPKALLELTPIPAEKESAEAWAVKCDAAWFIGPADAIVYPVAANVAFAVPSKTLLGWYAKAATTANLVLIGAARVTEGVA